MLSLTSQKYIKQHNSSINSNKTPFNHTVTDLEASNHLTSNRTYPSRYYLTLSISSILILSLVYIRSSSTSQTNLLPSSPGFNLHDLISIKEPNPSYLLTGYNGAVASEEGRCSRIGTDVLKENGTATDAAIATALCIGVVNAFSSGIGGGGFMVIKPPACRLKPNCTTSLPITIDFRETIPGGDRYAKAFIKNNTLSRIGGLAVGIPGELAGFEMAYGLYGGGVSWERLFEPSITLARGFEVGDALYDHLTSQEARWIKSKPEWDQIYKFGQTQKGDWIQRDAYAKTLEIVARDGIKAFYNGQLTKSLVETINREGGHVSSTDFETYRAIVKPAQTTRYLNRTIWTTDNPSSGPMLIYLLNLLEGYQLNQAPRDVLNEHRILEALKFAYARRTELADPRFLNQTQLDRIGSFVNKAFAEQTRQKIDDERTYDYQHYEPRYDGIEHAGTTHISVIDRDGSAVGLTSTVNLDFGSHVMDPKTGVIFNNENDDFSIPGRSNHFDLFSSPLNYPLKGKRPMSSMCPMIIENEEEVWAVLGSSGGSRIPSSVLGTLLKLDWGYDLSHAIEDARIHHQLLPNLARIETSYRPELVAGLVAKGHQISRVDIRKGLAAVHGVLRRPDGLLFASSDSRKHGVPDAY